VGQNPTIEIVVFGKVHWLTRAQFLENGERYAKMLRVESELLLGEIETLKQVWHETMEPGWMAATNTVTGWWAHAFEHLTGRSEARRSGRGSQEILEGERAGHGAARGD
jgi:hypothetical protein